MDLGIFSPYKVLSNFDTLEKIIKDKTVYPISCEVDPSNFCNHSCLWCINGKFRKRERVILDKDKLFDIINQLAEVKVKTVTFTGGGEPLTHPDIITALYFVREKGMQVALVTNGGLMDQEKADAVIETCTFIRFSLDAGEEKTYKKVHRAVRNTLQDILTWINYLKLKSSNLTIGVAFLVHPYNYREIHTAAYLVKEAGASYLQIRPVFMRGMKLSSHILKEMNEQIDKALDLKSELFKVYPIIHRFKEICRAEKAFDECLGHNLLGVIAANGKMYLCCQLRGLERYCLGDLYHKSFKDIWNGQQRKDIIRRINISYCPPCRYSKYNEVLSYLKGERQHSDFL